MDPMSHLAGVRSSCWGLGLPIYCIRVMLWLYYEHNTKENGSYYSILELYRDNGKEHRNYHNS